jgi:uncharacterized membrane protein YeiB
MQSISLSDASADLTPVRGNERIQALDVVRGFALIGIFLMNIEYFNRALSSIELGLPATMTGADWLAGWLIYNFVQGKFWTMFSFLFGMGFAVMLTRAERAERNFLRPYLRRIAALAVFGVLHHIFIWSGDILFSYAVGAVGLLILLFGDWKLILLALLALFGFGFLPDFSPLWQVAGGLAFMALAAFFLRNEQRVLFLGRQLPVFSVALLVLGGALALTALALWLAPGAADGARTPMTIAGIFTLAIGLLSARFHDPAELRTRRLGVAMYSIPFLIMTTFGAVHYFAPPEPAAAATASAGAKAADSEEAKDAADRAAERTRQKKEQAEQIAEETRIESRGTYLEAVELRASDFAEHAPGEAGFATVIVGMFLLGSWFVRSGVMENTGAHLPLFRKLALYALPFGLGLGLLGSAIATGESGLDRDPYQMASGLALLGNLPACLGYVSLIVLMLHSGTVLARIRVLAPLGRMALTNYLTHSILGTLYFYGYGLGHWGMPRAWQVLFVFVVIAVQVIFCHWWLARFRYGPMEWLWRAITYWQLPPMRREERLAVDARQLPT